MIINRPQSKKCARRLAGYVFQGGSLRRLGHGLLLFGGISLCAFSVVAQTSDFSSADQQGKESTTTSWGDNLLPTRLPTRITESHIKEGNRTVDKRSVEVLGTDGHFEPYLNIETEKLQLDNATVRTLTRTSSHDVNGKSVLVQVTEEEKHNLPGGDSNIARVTYNPDADGKLQPVQRDIMSTRKTGGDTEETNTTTLLTNIDGGLAPACKTREVRKSGPNNQVEIKKTTWLVDVKGKWQLSEIRLNSSIAEQNGRKMEETVFRPDAEGKLIQISHTVGHEFEDTAGEKRSSVETYSIDVPGAPQDGLLHLVERKTSMSHSSPGGEGRTDQKVERVNPGDPDAGLRVAVLVNGRMVPGPQGREASVTIRSRDYNGNLEAVEVDMTKSDQSLPVQIHQAPDQPK